MKSPLLNMLVYVCRAKAAKLAVHDKSNSLLLIMDVKNTSIKEFYYS
jgi:hypothetical protein